ncbi:MAG: hypothetical protein MUD17_06670 [Gemmatimonadaceae bacterium]|jgi:predicted AAA+ superfamily ATPase|nr:hypothetical protein [Gemmatimonadaceae bacterium]
MLPRLLLPELRHPLSRYPAVALVGPRQCGETTLALSLGGAYYDLEQQADRLRSRRSESRPRERVSAG